jgi:hypothetical protein
MAGPALAASPAALAPADAKKGAKDAKPRGKSASRQSTALDNTPLWVLRVCVAVV